MDLTIADWLTMIIGVLLTVGGAIGTLIMILLGFIIRRLIKSIDDLIISNGELKLSVNKRPIFSDVEETAKDAAEHRVVKHERDYKHTT